MTQPFPTKLPTIDVASITATIENALASAGLTTRGGPLQGVTETIRRALSSAYAGTNQESRGASRPIDAVVREIGPQSEPLALPGAEPSVRSPAGPGEFVTYQFRNGAGARAYRLYVPRSETGDRMPLIYSDAQGVPRLKSWVLHGAGHAWAGGDARGSYTDATGP